MKAINTLSPEQYLRASNNAYVQEIWARYDRGDFNYIEALELIAVEALQRNELLRDNNKTGCKPA